MKTVYKIYEILHSKYY